MRDTTSRHVGSMRASVEAFNRGDAAGYARHYAEDARLIGPFFPEPLVGRAVIEETAVRMGAAFPDMRWTIVSLLEDGDLLACELHIEGTHSGPLSTPDGAIPATGRRVSFDVAEVLEFTDDDLVAEHREYMDPGALMAQLGLSG